MNFRGPYGMLSSILIAQANVNCRPPPIRAIPPLSRKPGILLLYPMP